MINLIRKGLLLLAILCVNTPLVSWEGYDCCKTDRFYIGAFGGWLCSDSTRLTQLGTVYFLESDGGPLAIAAKGHAKNNSHGFGGVQIGYEWSPICLCSDWSFAPAAELEGLFYCNKKKGHLFNDSERLVEREFHDSFSMRSGVILANIVFSLNSPCLCGFSPYVGGGIGAIRSSIQNAKSFEIAEEGINHFNTDKSDSSWAFAAQVKAGLRYDICQSFHLFAEYRYIFVDSSNYVFGPTVYSGHATTSTWNVKMRDSHFNAFVLGFQYDL